jgi:hypothetical protein
MAMFIKLFNKCQFKQTSFNLEAYKNYRITALNFRLDAEKSRCVICKWASVLFLALALKSWRPISFKKKTMHYSFYLSLIALCSAAPLDNDYLLAQGSSIIKRQEDGGYTETEDGGYTETEEVVDGTETEVVDGTETEGGNYSGTEEVLSSTQGGNGNSSNEHHTGKHHTHKHHTGKKHTGKKNHNKHSGKKKNTKNSSKKNKNKGQRKNKNKNGSKKNVKKNGKKKN